MEKLKLKRINIIILLMIMGLIGLISFQYYYIKESYNLKTKLFDQSVIDVINSVVHRIEKNDVKSQLTQKIINEKKQTLSLLKDIEDRTKKYSEQKEKLKELNNLAAKKKMFLDTIAFFSKQIIAKKRVFRRINPKYFYDLSKNTNKLNDSIFHILMNELQTFFNIDEQNASILEKKIYNNSVQIEQQISFEQKIIESETKNGAFDNSEKLKDYLVQYIDSLKKKNTEEAFIQEMLDEISNSKIPIETKLQEARIEKILYEELGRKGIGLKCAFKIMNSSCNSVILTNANIEEIEHQGKNNDDIYEMDIFANQAFTEKAVLTLRFPEKEKFIWSNINLLLSSSISLVLLILSCFVYTIYVILRQKKISQMKTDFVNNMTHEFKTPIASIMLASNALKDNDINKNQDKVVKMASIICDENKRLSNNIESVLSVNKLDKNNIHLEFAPLNITALIEGVADSMEIQLQQNNAFLKTEFLSTHSTVMTDELHFTNVIFNLLENALKYSNKNPRIEIITKNNKSKTALLVLVKDNGIGIPKNSLKHIFDKFYRVHTGNLHNVKGFGLGLSYVHSIIKNNHGSIKVRSELGVGTEFEISLPLDLKKTNNT